MASRLSFKAMLVVAGAGVIAWAATSPSARAFPNPKKPNLATVYAPIIQELDQTHSLLALANHDYGGHRARAAAEVKKAIQILAHGFHKPKKQVPVVAGAPQPLPPIIQPKVGPVVEPQAVSNAQMRQAAKQIAVVIAQLTSSPPTRRSKAVVPLLQQAIVQIEQGLAYVRTVPPPPNAAGVLVK
jgi:hypothetical protein